MTVTPEREKQVAFTAPTRTNVTEIVVTDQVRRRWRRIDDLSGRDVFVRKTSSYYESRRR